jgi:pimeloyl-ACP methyl ester carboxylesterase
VTDDWLEATSGGQTFRYVDSGTGPLVVLLHGFPDLPTTWDSLRARLNEEGFRTVAPYLRGYHPDTFGMRGFSAEELAEDLPLLLDALGERTAMVVGHDWGASVTYGAATLYPDRVSKMVTLGVPHPLTLKPSLAAAVAGRHFLWFKLPWASTGARLGGMRMVDRFYRRFSPGWTGEARDASVAAASEAFRDPGVLAGALSYYKALQPGARLFRGRIVVPGLVVGGVEEPEVFTAGYASTPGRFDAPCEVHVLGGAGHWPHREQEQAFFEVLLPFLRG